MANQKDTETAAEATVLENNVEAEVEPVVEPAADAPSNEATAPESKAEAATSDAETEAVAAPDAETEAKVAPDPETLLSQAQQEAEQFKENWHRTAAELANYKRRQEEQRKLLRDRIKSEVLEGVISALDDMDLAFQNVPEELEGQLVGWVEGFRLVARKLDKILDDQNVMPINSDGEFDPNLHEAISYEENEDHEEGHIIAELRKGYQIGNRVIRPALVRVAK